MTTILGAFTALFVASELAVWAALVTARVRGYRRLRAWLGHGTVYERPDYRPVLAQMRAERERHGVPASFETEAVA